MEREPASLRSRLVESLHRRALRGRHKPGDRLLPQPDLGTPGYALGDRHAPAARPYQSPGDAAAWRATRAWPRGHEDDDRADAESGGSGPDVKVRADVPQS